jgi:AraC family transcriptional regulator, positive regulator of tynA and feaB
MTALTNTASNLAIKYSTDNFPLQSRREWLCEMITREYTKVEVGAPSHVQLFNETTVYPWQQLRLSSIRSHGIQIDRQKMEPYSSNQDNYLAVLLLSGRYSLEQNGREVFLEPGEITIYDATKPHRIYCPENFSKVIVSIPRKMMRDRLSGIEFCTARKVSNKNGVGLMTSHLIGAIVNQLNEMSVDTFGELSERALDFLTMSFASIRPQRFELSRSRSISLNNVKLFVAQHLSDASLNPDTVALAVGLSTRYINMLFRDENTSLMRFVLGCRLQRCYEDLNRANPSSQRVSDIAFKWGFNDVAHFSRAFRQAFDVTPTEVLHATQ